MTDISERGTHRRLEYSLFRKRLRELLNGTVEGLFLQGCEKPREGLKERRKRRSFYMGKYE